MASGTINAMTMFDQRIIIALYAFFAIILLQIFAMIFGKMMKRSMTPLPLFEVLLRPLVIGMVDRLNRDGRSDFALIIRGVIVFLVLSFVVFGGMIALKMVLPINENTFSLLVLMVFLSPITSMAIALNTSKDVPDNHALKYLARGLNQNLITTDKYGVRRSGVRLLSLSLVAWLIAPIVFFLLGGEMALCVYGMLSLFCRVVGRDGVFTGIFSIIYKMFNGVGQIVGVCVVFLSACLSAGGRPLTVINAFQYPTRMAEAAMAYAQGITVGGAFQNRLGDKIEAPWMGASKSTAKLKHQDILRVIIQYGISVLVVFIVLFLNMYI